MQLNIREKYEFVIFKTFGTVKKLIIEFSSAVRKFFNFALKKVRNLMSDT